MTTSNRRMHPGNPVGLVTHHNHRRGYQAELGKPEVIDGGAGQGFQTVFQVVGQISEKTGGNGAGRTPNAQATTVQNRFEQIQRCLGDHMHGPIDGDRRFPKPPGDCQPRADTHDVIAGAVQLPTAEQHNGTRFPGESCCHIREGFFQMQGLGANAAKTV